MRRITCFLGSMIGPVLLMQANFVHAQIYYTNVATSGFYWTNTTAWSVNGFYPGSQGGTEIAAIINGNQGVIIDGDLKVSDLLVAGPAWSGAVVLTNLGPTLTITNTLTIGDAAGNLGKVNLTSVDDGTFAITNAAGTAQLVISPTGGGGTLVVGTSNSNVVNLIVDQVTANSGSGFLYFPSSSPRLQGMVKILHGSTITVPSSQAMGIDSNGLLWFAGGTNTLNSSQSGSLNIYGSLLISGPGTVVNASPYYTSLVGNGASFIVSNGAKFNLGYDVQQFRLGLGDSTYTSNELLVVTGPGSTLNLLNLNTHAIVAGNPQNYTNHGQGMVIGAFARDTRAIITNGGCLLATDIMLGGFSQTNAQAGSRSNLLIVADGGMVTNLGTLRVGYYGSGGKTNGLENGLRIDAGGRMYSAFGAVGDLTFINNTTGTNYGNLARISGPGALWQVSGNIKVGLINIVIDGINNSCSSNNILLVQNGGKVLTEGLYVSTTTNRSWAGSFSGFGSPGATNNQVIVDGGSIYVTNAAGTADVGIGDVGQGVLVITNGGLLQADKLVLTNTPLYAAGGITNYFTNILSFNDGTLRTASTVYSNGTPFIVGNGGVATATLTLLGGTHRFSDGLAITNNGILTGTGTINGNVTVAGGGAVAPGSSPGTLTINGNLALSSLAVLNYDVGTSSDHLVVNGDVALNGVLNVYDAGSFGLGTNTLINYTGSLSGSGLTVGAKPVPSYSYAIDTSTAGQVKLVVSAGGSGDSYGAWLSQYGLSGGSAAGTADPDGDGMNNTNEFLTGFSPTSASAYLHVISVTRIGADIRVQYLGANGDNSYSGGPASRTNVLEYTVGSANGSYWTNNFLSTGQTNVLSGGSGAGVITNLTDFGGASAASRYYRVRVLLP